MRPSFEKTPFWFVTFFQTDVVNLVIGLRPAENSEVIVLVNERFSHQLER